MTTYTYILHISFLDSFPPPITIIIHHSHSFLMQIQQNKNLAMAMAAEKSMECLIGVMDRLWFHQIILFPETSSFCAVEDAKKPSEISPLPSVTDDEKESETDEERATNKARSHSSSSRNPMSLVYLELEEVKGFMDLGFLFQKENLTKRIIDLVPGLQRNIDEDRKEIMRPYLSEAWIIRRPDSPLLNLRVPRVSSAADMKKHLKFWAHTVASAIHQES